SPATLERVARRYAFLATSYVYLDRYVAHELVRRHPRGVVVAVQLAPRDDLRGPLALLRMGGGQEHQADHAGEPLLGGPLPQHVPEGGLAAATPDLVAARGQPHHVDARGSHQVLH